MYYLQQFYGGLPPAYEQTVEIRTSLYLCRELFADELKAGLSILDCDIFLSYKDHSKFNALVLNPLLDLLVLFHQLDPESARLAAGDMIRTLRLIDKDDDVFPRYEIELICDAVQQPHNYI